MAIKSYKGFDKNLRCRGFQYKIGGIYEMDGKIKMCNRGFHACESPFDVFDYYTMIDSRFCEYKKIVAGNEAGKNICFMSRGEYADPEIAYNGILMNYWDVYDCMDEVEEPTDDDWLNAVSNLFDSYTYDVKNTDVDKFKMSDVMNVYRIINL